MTGVVILILRKEERRMGFNYVDQARLFCRNDIPPINIIGAGGATNCVIVCLATMGVREIHIYDGDRLEERNGAGEPMYSDQDIGEFKVKAACNTVAYLRSGSDVKVVPHEMFVDKTMEFDGLVISGVDSMSARREIWEAVKKSPMVPLYVDFRSTGTSLTVLVVDPNDEDDVRGYEDMWMYTDGEAIQDVCGARNIPYIALEAGSLAGRIVAAYADRSLDFFLEGGIEKTIYFAEQDPFLQVGSGVSMLTYDQ